MIFTDLNFYEKSKYHYVQTDKHSINTNHDIFLDGAAPLRNFEDSIVYIKMEPESSQDKKVRKGCGRK